MRHRRHDPEPRPTEWFDPDPMVPQPTATGRAIVRMWIEEQLRLIADPRERRERRRRRAHHRD